jgi:hypothetical protein
MSLNHGCSKYGLCVNCQINCWQRTKSYEAPYSHSLGATGRGDLPSHSVASMNENPKLDTTNFTQVGSHIMPIRTQLCCDSNCQKFSLHAYKKIVVCHFFNGVTCTNEYFKPHKKEEESKDCETTDMLDAHDDALAQAHEDGLIQVEEKNKKRWCTRHNDCRYCDDLEFVGEREKLRCANRIEEKEEPEKCVMTLSCQDCIMFNSTDWVCKEGKVKSEKISDWRNPDTSEAKKVSKCRLCDTKIIDSKYDVMCTICQHDIMEERKKKLATSKARKAMLASVKQTSKYTIGSIGAVLGLYYFVKWITPYAKSAGEWFFVAMENTSASVHEATSLGYEMQVIITLILIMGSAIGAANLVDIWSKE